MRVTDERRAPCHGHVKILTTVGVPHATAMPAFNHWRIALRDTIFTVRTAGKKLKGSVAKIVGRVHQ
jgi:hypothetical protein